MTNILLYMLIFLQILDVASTYIILTKGIGTETNELLSNLMGKYGVCGTLILTKGLFIILLLSSYQYVIPSVLLLVVLFYCWVVINNSIIIVNSKPKP